MGESDTPFHKGFSFKSPVAREWSSIDYLAAGAAKGFLVVYSTQEKEKTCIKRRDVVNNAVILGPLIAEVGYLFAHNQHHILEYPGYLKDKIFYFQPGLSCMLEVCDQPSASSKSMSTNSSGQTALATSHRLKVLSLACQI